MDTQTPDAGGGAFSSSDEIAALKELRQQLQESIESHRLSQQELISSLKTLVPDLLPSLDLSLHLISSFNRRPFTPTPANPNPNPNPNHRIVRRKTLPKPSPVHPKPSPDRHIGDSPAVDLFSVVRTMVAVCLLELIPFTEIDSVTLLRRLEGEHSSATLAEKATLAQLGSILAIEMALRRISEESGGVQIEEFSVNGKPRVMIWNIDRNKLVKELPESSGSQPLREESGENKPGMEMWGPPLFSTGTASSMVGPPRMMGTMGMPRMMGVGPPMHRPPANIMGGQSQGQMKQRSEIDDLKEIEELVNKKTFRETQKSKTGEELLDLIHRPTAKETAVAAKDLTGDILWGNGW